MSQLPAHLQNRRSAVNTNFLAGLSSGRPAHISIRMNRFSLVDTAGEAQLVPALHLDVVMVDANPAKSKVYYEKDYDPSATDFAPPDCFSDNGVAPSVEATSPQSTTCAACPNNAWGSAVSRTTGKNRKACNDYKKVAVLLAESPAVLYLLQIPPASLKGLSAYVQDLASRSVGDRAVGVGDVVTRLTFDAQTQGVLNFEAVGWADERTVRLADETTDKGGADQLLGKLDRPRTGDTPARQAVAPPPAPTQIAPPPAPPPVEAPAKTRGRPRKVESEVIPPTQAPFMQQTPQPITHGIATYAPSPPNQWAAQGLSQQTAANQQSGNLEMPGFLRSSQPNNGAAPPPPPQAAFGRVASAPAPHPELAKAINDAFALPVRGR